jgi:hypothetical protein
MKSVHNSIIRCSWKECKPICFSASLFGHDTRDRSARPEKKNRDEDQ